MVWIATSFSPALEVAPHLLGARLSVTSAEGTVTIRVTEVEAYHGLGTAGPYDAGSHSKDRMTERNASMFGPPGHAYVYLSYGVHYALNLVCSPAGIASGVLLRAGEVIEGTDLARARRGEKRAAEIRHRDLARGPGNLAQALGIHRATHNGLDLFAPPFQVEAMEGTAKFLLERAAAGDERTIRGVPTGARVNDSSTIASGPRVGVSGQAGGSAFPWRFWLADDPTVSVYRPGRNVPQGE